MLILRRKVQNEVTISLNIIGSKVWMLVDVVASVFAVIIMVALLICVSDAEFHG